MSKTFSEVAETAGGKTADLPTWEVDRRGNHRVVYGERVGDWALYTGVATLVVRGVTYAGVTAYFEGVLPTNTVFVIKPVQSRVVIK